MRMFKDQHPAIRWGLKTGVQVNAPVRSDTLLEHLREARDAMDERRGASDRLFRRAVRR